jgi:hypothetical protein
MTKPKLTIIKGGAKKPGPVEAKRWITLVMSDRELPPHARVVAGYIGSLFNPTKGYAHPSIAAIVRDTGFGERTVYDAIKAIADRGHFMVKSGGGSGRGKGRANEYHLDFLTLHQAAGLSARKPCGRDPLTLREEARKPCGQPQTNKKDSNVEDSTSPRRATRVRASSEPRPAAHSRGSPQDRVPPAQESKYIRPEARSDGRLAPGSPPTSPVGKQDHESILQDIVACQFDGWNAYPFPDEPPIHPARHNANGVGGSKYQTPEAVCQAWCDAIDHATTITGERALSVELFRACGVDRAQKILTKAEPAKHPSAYVRKAIRNHKIRLERYAKANGAAKAQEWHPNDALAEIYDMMIGNVVPKSTIRKLINAVGPDRAVEIGEKASKLDDDSEIIAMVWGTIPEGTK